MKTHRHAAAVRAARKRMAGDDAVQSLSETFQVLSDPTRLRIVLALSRQELCVHDLAELLQITESAVSHQLRLLKTLRLVRQRREGKLLFSALDDEHIEDLIRVAQRHVDEP